MGHGIAVRAEKPGAVEATRITADDVLTRLARGEPLVFVDARREAEWHRSDEKLPGAYRVPPDALDQADTLPMIPRGRGIITYCTSPYEGSAARVAEILIVRGYSDVHPLHGGMEAWRRAGGTFSPK